MATIRERRRGVWEIRVFAGRDASGKPMQLSRTVRGDKRDAQRVAAELAVRPARAEGRRTVEELLAAWRELNAASWTPHTRRDQETRVRAIGKDQVMARMPLARLEVADVDQWIGRLRKAGVGEWSIRNQLQALRAALNQAVRWGWTAANPAAYASAGKMAKRAPRGVMSDDDVHAALAAAEQVHEMAPVALRLAAVTGARRSELAAMRWTDLVGDVLVIDSAITQVHDHPEAGRRRPVFVDAPTKTGERRRLALDAATVAMLEPLRAEREPVAPWMFSDSEEPPNPDRISHWWRRSRELAGIDKAWRLHDLRYWSATKAINAGYELHTVAARLGYADPSVTLRVHAHAVQRTDVELATRLGEALLPPTGS